MIIIYSIQSDTELLCFSLYPFCKSGKFPFVTNTWSERHNQLYACLQHSIYRKTKLVFGLMEKILDETLMCDSVVAVVF